MRKPIVGETLFLVDTGNRAKRGKQRECTVSKVGRKYFYIEMGKYWKIPFHIETWHEKCECIADYCVYESREEWEAEKRFSEDMQKLKQYFGEYKVNITANQTEQIMKILGIK